MSTEYVTLSDTAKLQLLQAHSFQAPWPSLDHQNHCLHCDRNFNGHSVRVWQSLDGTLWLECGTPGCDGSPIDWYPGRGGRRKTPEMAALQGDSSAPVPGPSATCSEKMPRKLKRRLVALREKFVHSSPPKAFAYFFDEVFGACTVTLFQHGRTDNNIRLHAAITERINALLGAATETREFKTSLIADFQFFHGSAVAPGYTFIYCYFEAMNRGLIAAFDDPWKNPRLCGFDVDPPILERAAAKN